MRRLRASTTCWGFGLRMTRWPNRASTGTKPTVLCISGPCFQCRALYNPSDAARLAKYSEAYEERSRDVCVGCASARRDGSHTCDSRLLISAPPCRGLDIIQHPTTSLEKQVRVRKGNVLKHRSTASSNKLHNIFFSSFEVD